MTGACSAASRTASRRSVHGWSRNGDGVHGCVDGPLLATGDLEDEDVVDVVVVVEALVLRWSDVGVGLDRVPEVGGQLLAEVDDRRPDAVQGLQHEGGAAGEERGQLVVADLVGDAGARGHRGP